MSSDTFFKKQTSIHFVVKNISPIRKKLTIFNYPIFWNQTRDLLAIPEISESDIRHSLIKGELSVKIRAKDLIIVSSDIDLLQFDDQQKSFLKEAGVSLGTEISVNEVTSEAYDIFTELPTPDFSKFILDLSGSFVYTGDGDITLKS